MARARLAPAQCLLLGLHFAMASPTSLAAFPEAGIMPRDDTEVSSITEFAAIHCS